MSKSRELADLIDTIKNSSKKSENELFELIQKKEKEISDSKEYLRHKMDMLENRSKFQETMDKIKSELDGFKAAREEFVEKGRNAIENSAPSLEAIQDILHTFMKYNANISVAVVSTFFTIAMKEGLRMTDYVAMTGLPKSTMSRHLLELGPATVSYTRGMGLIEIANNEIDNSYWENGEASLGRDKDKFYTKTEQLQREKQRASRRAFFLSRKGMELLDRIKLKNSDAVNHFMRSVSQ